MENLKAFLNIDQVVTFGSIEDKYDVYVRDADKDIMVKTLKDLYEPVKLKRIRN